MGSAAPRHVESSQSRDHWTRAPCLGRRILNHWTTGKSQLDRFDIRQCRWDLTPYTRSSLLKVWRWWRACLAYRQKQTPWRHHLDSTRRPDMLLWNPSHLKMISAFWRGPAGLSLRSAQGCGWLIVTLHVCSSARWPIGHKRLFSGLFHLWNNRTGQAKILRTVRLKHSSVSWHCGWNSTLIWHLSHPNHPPHHSFFFFFFFFAGSVLYWRFEIMVELG